MKPMVAKSKMPSRKLQNGSILQLRLKNKMPLKSKTMKTNRIIDVATDIATSQSRRAVIAARVTTLTNELKKLTNEDVTLASKQVDLQREMDRLATPR